MDDLSTLTSISLSSGSDKVVFDLDGDVDGSMLLLEGVLVVTGKVDEAETVGGEEVGIRAVLTLLTSAVGRAEVTAGL